MNQPTISEIVKALFLAEDSCFNADIDNAGRFRALAERIEAHGIAPPEGWEAVASHLRYCRECAEMDVMDCEEGKALWLAAAPKGVSE